MNVLLNKLQEELSGRRLLNIDDRGVYEIRTYRCFGKVYQGDDYTISEPYDKNVLYLGSIDMIEDLINSYGIDRFEKAIPKSTIASIGYSPSSKKWYGWSHRAIHGFSIGDVVCYGDPAAEYLPVGFISKTLEDSKEMAKAFARSVS
jgi:hypothetical protein